MATVAQPHQVTVANVRPSPIQTSDGMKRVSPGPRESPSEPSPMASSQPTTPAPVAASKKGKGKKNADPVDASKQIAAKIAQLEQNAAGEKDQEIEIGRFLLQGVICKFLVQRQTDKSITLKTRSLIELVEKKAIVGLILNRTRS